MYQEQHYVQEPQYVDPHPNDVLCGRGSFSNTHEGNRNWRRLVNANKELYAALPKFQKQLLSQSIVSAVSAQNPPGRFLQRDAKTQLWYHVGETKAIEKTSQALREGGILARTEDLYERGITPESLNLTNPLMSAKQLTLTEDQAPSAINIYMPSVKDARKIVSGGSDSKGAAAPKVEEPANVQATSMYNSQQQQYGSLQHELYGHQQPQQDDYSNPYSPQQQQQQVPYDHQSYNPAPRYSSNPYNHHAPPQYPLPQGHQGPPSSNNMPYPPPPPQQQQQQYPPSNSHPPLPRGMDSYFAPVSVNTNRPPCGGGGAANNTNTAGRAAEIIAAAIAASHAADSSSSNANSRMSTPPATNSNMLEPTPIYYPPAVSNNTTQEVSSVSTLESGSKVSHDGSNSKASYNTTRASNAVVYENGNDNTDARDGATVDTTEPSRPEPLAKPVSSLGTISAMSMSQVMPTIQTSFGSMSLEESSLKKATLPNKIDTSAPTLTHHERSKGDLLDDSDSDEDEETSNENTAADWEKMRAAFGITENDFRPVGNVTGMDLTRDISEMSREISGMSMGDFSLEPSSSGMFMMRDTTIGSIDSKKKDEYEMSEEEMLEKMLLSRGKSLVNEDFATKEEQK